jgi:pimeloyl-ACP methyl ester carboxylesterase
VARRTLILPKLLQQRENTPADHEEDLPMTTNTPLAWSEPAGLAARGTVVVLPGRGERPGLYERFGKRLAADAYRVHVVEDATGGEEGVEGFSAQVKALLEAHERPGPAILAGSDTGALLALRLVALGSVTADALVLAGLPDTTLDTSVDPDSEAEQRASCPGHQKLLRGGELLVPGTLTRERIPEALREPLDLASVTVPVLGLHGDNDFISPIEAIRSVYSGLPHAELLTVDDGRHDVLNASHHRSVAASVVLFLERLRLGADLPTIVQQSSKEHPA